MSLKSKKKKKQKDTEVVEIVRDEFGEVDVEKTEKGLRDSVRKTAAATQKKKVDRFLWIKVWVHYLISLMMKDRGKIPDNIGDRILITSNLYITKLYMTTIVKIYEFGPNSPVTLLGVLNSALREKGNKAILDLTCKNRNYDYDPKNGGLKSRIRAWENTVNSEYSTRKMRERAVRCLYTVEVANSGKQLKHTRAYLSIRAKDIVTLNTAEKIIYDCLGHMGCLYMPAHNTIRNDLEFISMLGNKLYDKKGNAAIMTTNTILSQIVPNCGSFNDRQGYYIGQNIKNGTPYYLDTSSITKARNMYVVAPSGVGKTVLAANMMQSAYEIGAAVCAMDIKGNEYTNFINATNGYTISLRANSIEFINSWVMRKSDVVDGKAESYFKSRVNFSKQQMIILSGIRDRSMLLELEELLDEFHDSLYVTIGAIPGNVNSWYKTESLTPYDIFMRFETFFTPQKRAQYSLPKNILGTLRMYMSANGSKSYIFKKEFDYAKILKSDTLSFDFGILADTSISDIDEDLFRLKFLYMQKLNSDFTTRKYAEGKRTLKILEESQIVSDDIMEMYTQEYTLRRSQNQDTLLLGNSVQALSNSKIAQKLIENTTGLFVGELVLDARNTIIQQFDLSHLADLIKIPGSTKQYSNCFVFVNKMQKKNLYPIIQVQIPTDENKGKPKQYKVNTPVKEQNVMSGS